MDKSGSETKCEQSKLNASRLSIIIPARNEEKSILNLLNSLACQSVAPYEIILVNDQSTDATEEIARTFTSRAIKIINIDSLPKGWLGKSWSCFTGANNSGGELLLFLDADTTLEKNGIEKILGCYSKYGRGVISVQPFHKIKELYENFSAYFNIIIMGAINVFTPFQFRFKPIGAFGPCMLCEKKDYFKIGGHAIAKAEILEDLEIGKKFLKSNIPLYCFGGKGTISFRMYPNGLKDIIHGFSRGFTMGAKSTAIINLLIIIAWIAGAFFPVTLIFQNIIQTNIIELTTGLIFYAAYAAQLYWMLWRIGSFNIITAIFFPVFLIFFIIIFFWSLILNLFKLKISWKGRSVK